MIKIQGLAGIGLARVEPNGSSCSMMLRGCSLADLEDLKALMLQRMEEFGQSWELDGAVGHGFCYSGLEGVR